MTTIDHGLQGLLIGTLFTDDPLVLGICTVGGAWPDIDGWLGRRMHDRDRRYNWWHHEYRWWYILIPPLALHWSVDWVMHEPDGKWFPREFAFCIFIWLIEGAWVVIELHKSPFVYNLLNSLGIL